MTKPLSIPADIAHGIIANCAAIAQSRNKAAARRACTMVATLIANAGTLGGSDQVYWMDVATELGFAPEFYADSIRVYYRAA